MLGVMFSTKDKRALLVVCGGGGGMIAEPKRTVAAPADQVDDSHHCIELFWQVCRTTEAICQFGVH